MNQKSLAPILIILLIALAFGGYLIHQKQTYPTSLPQQTAQPTSTPSSTVDTTNWKTFYSVKGKYSIKYPENLASNYSGEDNQGGVMFVLKKDKEEKDKQGIRNAFWPISLQIWWRDKEGSNPEDAFLQENSSSTYPNPKDREKIVTLNNAQGFGAKDIPYDYYLTNQSDTTPVYRVRLSYQSSVSDLDITAFRQMLQTFKFTQ